MKYVKTKNESENKKAGVVMAYLIENAIVQWSRR